MTTSTGAADAPRGTPAFMLALIEQDRARRAAAEREDAQRATSAAERAWLSRAGSRNASSAVFTLRLGREEFGALHREASMRSVPPSVLARNLIRYALTHPDPPGAPGPARDLQQLARRVRSAALRAAPSAIGARARD